MNSICWITKRPTRFESQRFGALCDLIARHGIEIQWLQAPATPNLDMQAWLKENILEGTRAIFFSDKDLEMLKNVTKSLKLIPMPELRAMPVFWVYADMDVHLLDRMVEVGVDDFFHISHNPHDVLSRLKLRCREASQRAKVQGQLKTTEVEDAKTKTTVQQREEFLSVCAHDLRSPLGLIQSSLSLILDTKDNAQNFSETQIELLNRARRQSTHALTLVNDLLDVMSFEQGFKPHYKLLNLHNLLSEFHTDYKQQAEQKGVQFHYENPISEWRVLADPERVRQLLQNLITNALKFTSPGKNIFLHVNSFEGRRKSDPPYPMLVISVRDEGVGIASPELQKIFDRFSQIKEYSRGEGRGLGLTVAKQISSLHEGNIWVESKEGEGSTFFVLFPHVISMRQPTVSKTTPLGGKRSRVLIAEPSLEKRERYFRQLEAWGYEIVFAKDGVEALAMLFHDTPNILILTPELSKMSETEILSIARSEITLSDTTMLVAAADVESIDPANRHLVESHLIKLPLSKASFQDIIEKLKKPGPQLQALPTKVAA